MPREWARLDLEPYLKGLFLRQKDTPNDILYAAIAKNLDVHGGSLGLRPGNLPINGWCSYTVGLFSGGVGAVFDTAGFVPGDWVDVADAGGGVSLAQITSISGGIVTFFPTTTNPSPGSRIMTTRQIATIETTVNGTWGSTSTGNVTDSTFFVIGEGILIIQPNGTELFSFITNKVGPALTVTPAFAQAPLNGARVLNLADRTVPGNLNIYLPLATQTTLFQAIFRNGDTKLLSTGSWPAAATGSFTRGFVQSVGVLELVTNGTPRRWPLKYVPDVPKTTVAVNWGSGTTGTLTSAVGLRVGDWVAREGVGTQAHSIVTAVDETTGVVSVLPGFSVNPTAGQTIYFFPQQPIRAVITRDTTGAITAVALSLPATNEATMAQFGNMTHIAFENYPPLKFYFHTPSNAYKLHRHGIVRSQLPYSNTSTGAAGLPDGDYRYRITFRNSVTGQESEPTPLYTGPPQAAAMLQISLAAIPVSIDPQVDRKRIYRTLAGGATYFQVGEIANATTGFTDNMGDAEAATQRPLRLSSTGQALDTPASNDISVFATWPHANRLMAINGKQNTVVFSDNFDLTEGALKPEAWPVDNQIFVSYDDGDPLTALGAFFDSQIAMKQRSIHRISGIPPDVSVEPVSFRGDRTGIGCVGPKAFAIDQNELVFLASDGFYQLNRYEGVQQGFENKRLSRPIDDFFDRSGVGGYRSHLIYFRCKRQIRSWVVTPDADSLTTGAPVIGLMYQYDGTPTGEPFGWYMHEMQRPGDPANLLSQRAQVTASAAASALTTLVPDVAYLMVDDPSIGQRLKGLCCAMDSGFNDFNVAPVDWQYQTVRFCPGGYGVPSRIRAFDLVVRPTSSVTLGLQLESDFVTQGSVSVSVNSSADDRVVPVLMLARGTWHAFKLTYTAPATFRIQNIALWYQALPKKAQGAPILQASGFYP